MLKIKLKNLFWTAAALFCATQFCSAQSSDTLPTIGVPLSRPAPLIPNSDTDLTMGGEYKSTKEVVQQEKPVCYNWYAEGGYTSEYIFRGTNLMPDSDGGGFLGAQVSRWGFTLGVWEFTSSAPHARQAGQWARAGEEALAFFQSLLLILRPHSPRSSFPFQLSQRPFRTASMRSMLSWSIIGSLAGST